MPAQLTKEEFIRRASLRHGNRYSYEGTVMRPNPQFIEIICAEHGMFQQTAGSHIAGHGCPQCALAANGRRRRKSRQDHVADFVAKHGAVYDYSLLPESFIAIEKIDILCPVHGAFQQVADVHRVGKGCPKCGAEKRTSTRKSNGTFTGWPGKRTIEAAARNKAAMFYLLRCYNQNEAFFKIGVTSKVTIKGRFPSHIQMPYKYQVLREIKGDDATAFVELESQLKAEFARFKYSPSLSFNGYSECFSLDSGIDKAVSEAVISAI